MVDNTLTAHILPSEFLIRGFIRNEPDCNYEKYMLEFINESTYFRNKSENKKYAFPNSEEKGQCDCISEKYQLDFKLIASKTILHAKSILFPRKNVINEGIVVTESPKVQGKTMEGTRIHAAIRSCNYEMLCELRQNVSKVQGVENDIYELLETMETQKNLMLLFPYKFTFDKEYKFIEGVSQIQRALSNDFQYVMQYRNYVADGYDTYVAFIYDNRIVFMEEKDNDFVYIDNVELIKSSVYQKMLRYSEIF